MNPSSPNPGSEPGTRRIVCGTDFSEQAQGAVRVASAWSAQLRKPLSLIHAMEMPHLGASHAQALEWLSATRRELLVAEALMARELGAEVEEQILVGRADEVLVNSVSKGDAKLLVLASLGRRAPERWVLGSISERTAERSAVPTLIVRDSAPLEAWLRGDRPLRVFVAFNFTSTAASALRWARDLAALGPVEWTIGYVDWPPEQQQRFGFRNALSMVGNPQGVQALLERDLKRTVMAIFSATPFDIQVKATWGRPDVRLSEMAGKAEADLVVAGSHQYHGFERLWHGSVSRGLLHGASMNVAIVPLETESTDMGDETPALRRVLTSTDFSLAADQAIAHAYSLLPAGGTVLLLHVVSPSPGIPSGTTLPSQLADDPDQSGAHPIAMLQKRVPIGAGARGVVTEFEVVAHQDAAQAIEQAAARFGADAICVATHGRSGLFDRSMGSVARTLVEHCQKPVLVVRSQPE